MILLPETLAEIFPNSTQRNRNIFCTTFNNLGWLHLMTDKLEVAAYLSQIGQETAELLYTEEIASGQEYEGNLDLGNTQVGDGRKFKGRGYLQCTGRWNYSAFTKWYNLKFKESKDFEAHPEEISKDAALCQIVSIWFWQMRKIKKPALSGNLERVTKLVNGGLNGYNNRIKFYHKALEIL